MTNEHQKTAKKPGEQTTAPDPQIELTDEQLEQVTGGFEPNSTNQITQNDGSLQDVAIQKKWLPAN